MIGSRIFGTVSGHPRQEEFAPFNFEVATSTVLSINELETVAETLNTIYTLGKKLG